MKDMILKSNSHILVGDKPVVLLPLEIYEKLTEKFEKISSKNFWPAIKKARSFAQKGGFMVRASESSLSKDWLKPQEEKAWQNL